MRTSFIAVIALAAAFAARAQTQDPYGDLVMRMQERLNALGFDAGPPNGAFEGKTQAALAQFQLSRLIPASGQLDDQTLAELGIERLVASPQVEAPQDEASAGR